MPVSNIPPFGLRMQPELKRRVEEAAKANQRSLNAEIVARLDASFREADRPSAGMNFVRVAKAASADALAKKVADLEVRLARLEAARREYP